VNEYRREEKKVIRSGDRLENPVTGEVLVFRRISEETNGEAVLVETIVRPDGFVAAAHVHPQQTERFEVLEGLTMVCSKGFGAGSKSGRFAGRTPITRRMAMPMRSPDDCNVSGSGQLSRSGRVTVLLFKQP
jgi:hypothetical protein